MFSRVCLDGHSRQDNGINWGCVKVDAHPRVSIIIFVYASAFWSIKTILISHAREMAGTC
jgi:hypothetical protein